MFNKNVAIFMTISSLMFTAAATSADPVAPVKPDIKVMPADTRPVDKAPLMDKDKGLVRPDDKIQSDVRDLIKAKFPGFTPTIKVIRGDVELKGKVKDADMEKSIKGEVIKVPGVKGVILIIDK